MGTRWWCVAVSLIVGACQLSRASEDPAGSGAGGVAGASASAGSSAGVGPLLGIGAIGSSPDPLPQGSAGSPDISGVLAPDIQCHGEAPGGQSAGGEGGTAAAPPGVAPIGGAPFDDNCAPPPSVCLDDLVLVYFNEGECVAGRCQWRRQSLACRNACRQTGCQDSITTK